LGKNSKTLSVAPASDIRGQLEEALATLAPLTKQATKDAQIQTFQIREWQNRISRATNVLTRVVDEGKKPTELLLEQAKEALKSHEAKLSQAKTNLKDLEAYQKDLYAASEHFKMLDRQEELQKRINGISATVATLPLGDEKKSSYDVRELERTIHTVKALIELKKVS
jgi:5-bromo-4-chloroindolyl phosphate hydrolysis protein